MKSVVVYDSAFGNTAKVAEAIRSALAKRGECSAKLISDVTERDLKDIDLLLIGSPTQAGRPTAATMQFVEGLPPNIVKHAKVAVFDTRFDPKVQKRGLRMLMAVIGYAAPKIAEGVKRKGGKLVVEPMGFIVNETEGPMHEGELERAAEWAEGLK